jgi:hypothetical protein
MGIILKSGLRVVYGYLENVRTDGFQTRSPVFEVQ